MWSRICSEILEQRFWIFYINMEIISSLDLTKHKKQYKRCGLKAMFNKNNYLKISYFHDSYLRFSHSLP